MPTINKVAYDYANIEADISFEGKSLGIPKEAIEDISYSWTLNDEVMHGGSRLPVDRTEGEVEFEGSITFHRFGWNHLVATAGELGVGIANLELTIAVSYARGSNPVITDTLVRVRIKGGDHGNERGPDPTQVECDIHPMNIYYDGIDVLGNLIG